MERVRAYAYHPDKSDPVAYLRSVDQLAKEKEVMIQSTRLLQEDIKLCYRREGTNHGQACRELVKQYRELISSPAFGGPTKTPKPAAAEEED